MNTLAHILSNMTNEECFRLTGALPTARIADLLDQVERFNAAAATVEDVVEGLDFDNMPERFVEAFNTITGALSEWGSE